MTCIFSPDVPLALRKLLSPFPFENVGQSYSFRVAPRWWHGDSLGFRPTGLFLRISILVPRSTFHYRNQGCIFFVDSFFLELQD